MHGLQGSMSSPLQSEGLTEEYTSSNPACPDEEWRRARQEADFSGHARKPHSSACRVEAYRRKRLDRLAVGQSWESIIRIKLEESANPASDGSFHVVTYA